MLLLGDRVTIRIDSIRIYGASDTHGYYTVVNCMGMDGGIHFHCSKYKFLLRKYIGRVVVADVFRVVGGVESYHKG